MAPRVPRSLPTAMARALRSSLLRAAAVAAVAALPACGTVHTARWVFGMPSCFEPPSREAEETGLRVIVAVPVIVGGVAFDAVTWPFQLAFGVWPMWGPYSLHLKPKGAHEKMPTPDP
jgi:hypothetical protein